MASKITNDQIAAILDMQDKFDQKTIERYTGISKSQVSRVVTCARKLGESEEAARRWSEDVGGVGIYKAVRAYLKPQPVEVKSRQISFDIPAEPQSQQEYNDQLRILIAKLDVLIDIARAIREQWS